MATGVDAGIKRKGADKIKRAASVEAALSLKTPGDPPKPTSTGKLLSYMVLIEPVAARAKHDFQGGGFTYDL
jgi:hypothetical protein